MMSVTYTIEGLEELMHSFMRAASQADEWEREIRVETLEKIGRSAKEMAPVLTGALRDSIVWDENEVGPTIRYAPFVEFGTSKMAPQPFLGPAADRHIQEYYDRMAEVFGARI